MSLFSLYSLTGHSSKKIWDFSGGSSPDPFNLLIVPKSSEAPLSTTQGHIKISSFFLWGFWKNNWYLIQKKFEGFQTKAPRRLVQGGALDARKKTRESDQPWPPAPYFFKDKGLGLLLVLEGKNKDIFIFVYFD